MRKKQTQREWNVFEEFMLAIELDHDIITVFASFPPTHLVNNLSQNVMQQTMEENERESAAWIMHPVLQNNKQILRQKNLKWHN